MYFWLLLSFVPLCHKRVREFMFASLSSTWKKVYTPLMPDSDWSILESTNNSNRYRYSSSNKLSLITSITLKAALLMLLIFLTVSLFPLLGIASSIPSSLFSWGDDQHIYSSNSVSYTVESLTRDVQIKQIHSHNDYWRERPLFDALSYGAVSVEADIWHFPKGFILTPETSTDSNSREFSRDELYVGHSLVYLHPENTLNDLYLNPIFDLLKQANPGQTDSDHKPVANITFGWDEPDINGIFFDFPEEPLYLWFDIKTEPVNTYNKVKPLLQRFIDNGFLSYYDTNTKKFHQGPIILTLTGNLPTEMIKSEEIRYVFLDGALSKFKLDANEDVIREISELSKVASGSLEDLIGGQANYHWQ